MGNNILSIDDVKKILPQRYPFLMIDRIIETNLERVVAIKNVSINEPFFEGHFPDKKVMPGVMMIEAMAQAGIILVWFILSQKKDIEPNKHRIYFLGGVNKARFYQPVVPGDQLKIEVRPVKIFSTIGIISAEVFVDDKKVAQAEISFSIKEI